MAPNQCRLEHGPLLNSCGLALSQGTEPSSRILVGKHSEMSYECVLEEVTNISLLHIEKIEDDFLLLQNSSQCIPVADMDTFAFSCSSFTCSVLHWRCSVLSVEAAAGWSERF